MKTLITVLLSAASLLTLFGSPNSQTAVPDRTFTFAERVSYERAIEEVYWRHRIWPKENPGPKPTLDPGMSQAQLEKKVEDYLRHSLVLEEYGQKLITAEQLQAEMDRMARDTRQPEVLRELFEALGNDPAVIAECLARPILAERLIADLSAQGQTRLFDSPRTDNLRTMSVVTTLAQVAYTLPSISDGPNGSIDDTWTPTSTASPPPGRAYHTAVWTGSEMIVWGGSGSVGTGWRYNPSTDSWAATTSPGPIGRSGHTAVWTGSEMIVWGGGDNSGVLNTGGRYNPSTDIWTATSITNAPEARSSHTAVWTGSEMIVWGGAGNSVVGNTGGRYNPSTDSWTATSTINAPSARSRHTAVWTGSEMIVWGGSPDGYSVLNAGGRYNPSTNSWTPTSTANAPSARVWYTAVWTGSEMIVWGGSFDGYSVLNTGGRYNPSTDSWTATSTTNAPEAREYHTAVWTGSEMIVWGGSLAGTSGDGIALNTGGRYNPSTDNWTATSITNAPDWRLLHTAVWTGSEMIVWGGLDGSLHQYRLNTGGRYGAPTGPSPAVTTNPATNVATFSATLNGSVNPRGVTTTVYFQYGPTTSYGHTTATQTKTGNTSLPITANISGLSASTTYHFRIVATNGGGTSFGPDRTFTTLIVPPVVTTNPATNVASVSATLNGSVNPRGSTTTVRFQYGPTTSYGHTTATQTKTGNTSLPITANISGLSASTTYHFRIVATNGGGTSFGPDRTFTTLSATGPPVVVTNPVTLIASFSTTLNGSLDPHGLTTSVYFQYGTTTGYGFTTPPQSQTGNTYRNVSANISGLSASTTYHFRIVATNSAGTKYGSDRTFTTLSPTGPLVVATSAATNLASFSAALNGSVYPHGLATSVYFQYGTTTSYGSTTAPQTKTGNTYQSVSANIGSLTPSTTFHYRIVASNGAGTRYGSDRIFTTLTATGPPVVTTNPATNVATSSATLQGALDPHGLTTSVYFQYGTTTNYGHTTPMQSQTGNTYRNIAANIGGLATHTTYHFRIVATNTAGTKYGSDRTFTTQ